MFGLTTSILRMACGIAVGTAALLAAGTASARTPFASYGQSANQIAVGTALDSQAGTPPASRAALFSAIDAQPTAAARASALGQLTPQSYELLPRLVIQTLDAQDAMLQPYLADRRDGSTTPTSPATTATRGDITMSLMGDVRKAKYHADGDRPALKSDSRSISFAIDYKIHDNIILGAMIGIDGLDARIDPRRPRLTLFNSHLGPYASFTKGRFYVMANGAYNFGEYKLRREVSFPGFIDRLTSHADSDSYAMAGETGYKLPLGPIKLEPFAGVHYRHVKIAGFTETGGPAALQLASYRTKSIESALGARASATVVKGAWTLRPAVQAEWRRELNNKADSNILAQFATGDLAAFTLKPNRLVRDYATVGAGVTATYNNRTSIRLAYNGQLATDRRIHGAVLTISRRF